MFMAAAAAAAAAAKLLQSCPTLCNPIDGSPPAPPSLGFSHGHMEAGKDEWPAGSSTGEIEGLSVGLKQRRQEAS